MIVKMKFLSITGPRADIDRMRQTPLPQAQALQPVLVTLQQLLLPVFPASVAVLP